MDEKLSRVMNALKKHGIEPYFAENRAEAKARAVSLLKDGDTVAVGGSVTLDECGILDELRSGRYHFLDRYAPLTPEEKTEIFRQSLLADNFLTGTSAITEDGFLYNVDGTANRVSALLFGPKQVIVIAGINKIVPDLEAAVLRVKTVSAPLNTHRLNIHTYCYEKGHCLSIDQGKGSVMCAGCEGENRICHDYTVVGPQTFPGRIKLILVGEELGY